MNISRRSRWVVVISVIMALLSVALIGWIATGQNRTDNQPITDSQPDTQKPVVVDETPREVASNLVTPWSILLLPDGDLLVSERSGSLKRIGEQNQTIKVDGVAETSEGGLHGIVLDPSFANNNFIYVYHTTGTGGQLTNRVVRYVFEDSALSEPKVILSGIPAGNTHNGSAIDFGPDGKLYVSTGDAGNGNSAQDRQSLAGKILRLNADGSTPSDNPFGSPVWSYGHRNPQGIAWDDKGNMWSVEHGRSGAQSGQDELNLIKKGANYGWPTIRGDGLAEGMEKPVMHSGDTTTWAPSGLGYMQGSLYFAGLRGQTLYRAVLDGAGGIKEVKTYFSGQFGRLRAVEATADTVYFSTSNRDGRGSPKDGDDRIFKVQFKP